MFPNVRMLIVALFASIVTLFIGLGVLATFGISREPIGRLPQNTVPFQLTADDGARTAAAMLWDAAPASGALNQTQLATATAIAVIDPDHPGAVAAPTPARSEPVLSDAVLPDRTAAPSTPRPPVASEPALRPHQEERRVADETAAAPRVEAARQDATPPTFEPPTTHDVNEHDATGQQPRSPAPSPSPAPPQPNRQPPK